MEKIASEEETGESFRIGNTVLFILTSDDSDNNFSWTSQNKNWGNDLLEHTCDQDDLITKHTSCSLTPKLSI
jgi:hypothetical protein